MHDLKSDIKSVAIRLVYAYLAVLLLTTTGSIWINNALHKRLAIAFSESAHNSLVTNDIRQAISILTPALNTHFTSVSLQTVDGSLTFSLPSEIRTLSEDRSFLTSSIISGIETSTSAENSSEKFLKFTFRWADPAIYTIVIWMFFLTLAFPIFRQLKSKIEKRHTEILEVQSAELMTAVTSQVSHDIRSPLAALNSVLSSDNPIDDKLIRVAKNSIKRINDIANQLLDPTKYKSHVESYAALPVSKVIEEIIFEKLAELGDSPRISISSNFSFSEKIFIAIPSIELSRILSNLINNSIDAISDSGVIQINARIQNGLCEIDVSDSGKGIPAEIISHLGKYGFSFEKTKSTDSGNGLGLFHAKSTIENYDGSVFIQSTLGQGTVVSLKIPVISKIGTAETGIVTIVIDNDSNILQLWEVVACKRNRPVICFSDPRNFYSISEQFDRRVPIFIDVELDNNLRGEDVAETIAQLGFTNISLSTGHSPSSLKAPPCVKRVVGKEPIFD